MILNFKGWNATRINAAVLGDTVWIDPVDPAVSSLLTYTITTAPAGSTATFSGTSFTPDLVGEYFFTLSAGNAAVGLTLYVFSTAAYAKPVLALLRNGMTARSEGDKRVLLGNVANAMTPAQLVAFNSTGVLPVGVSLYSLGAA